jgi:hypothetical protein
MKQGKRLSKSQLRLLRDASRDGSEDFFLSMMLGLSREHVRVLRQREQTTANDDGRERVS